MQPSISTQTRTAAAGEWSSGAKLRGWRFRMEEDPKDLVRRWFEEVWNKQRTTAIPEMFDADGEAQGLPEPDSLIRGPEEFKQYHQTLIATFPDIRLHLEDLIAEGDKVAVRWTATGTHLGDALGYAPTRRKVSLNGSSFLVCRGGKILKAWNQMDFARLLTQLQ